MAHKPLHIGVVGGGGHVGLPLSMLLAKKGFKVTVIESDKAKVARLKRGIFPFMEEGGPALLKKLKARSQLTFTTQHRAVQLCDAILLTVGTPVDIHLNPDLGGVFQAIQQIKPYLRKGQVVILRSTLYPGTSEKIFSLLQGSGTPVSVAFCPERIAQGKALMELEALPQIISASDEKALKIVREIFSTFAPTIIELSMTEAEVAKLFSNTWRYIKFAVANQFYMLCEEKDLDFYRIRGAMTRDYDRMADFPSAGFAAGPCLFKDTMQLAAYNRQNFQLGHSSMLINETMPDFLVEKMKRNFVLDGKPVGILGMAFKANSDDKRESLAYKLRRLLQLEGLTVLCSDPYVGDDDFVPVENVLMNCSIIFIGCPHGDYRKIRFTSAHHLIDCWGLLPEHG